MASISIVVAFVAGIVSFASPCCLPLVPAYVELHGRRDPRRRPAAAGQPSTSRSRSSSASRPSSSLLWASIGLVGYVFRDYASGPPRGRRCRARLHGPQRRPASSTSPPSTARSASRSGRWAAARWASARQRPRRPATAGRRSSESSSRPAGRRASARSSAGSSAWPRSARASLEGTILLVAYAVGLAIPFILVAVGATSVSQRLGWLRDHDTAVSHRHRRDAHPRRLPDDHEHLRPPFHPASADRRLRESVHEPVRTDHRREPAVNREPSDDLDGGLLDLACRTSSSECGGCSPRCGPRSS